MAGGKPEKTTRSSFQNPNKHKVKAVSMKKNTKRNRNDDNGDKKSKIIKTSNVAAKPASASEQLSFFFDQYRNTTGAKLSLPESESINDKCFVELLQDLDQDAGTLGLHIKTAFGKSWKEALCEGQIVEGKVGPGSPAVLVFSASAIKSLELLRGLRSLTSECHAAKLFSKHMKVEEQVTLLKNRVNIASGTPSRVKKLIDMKALGLSRLNVIVLDMQLDVKGYSLLTLPQVRDEFWELYKSHFHQRLLLGDLRICLYGPLPAAAAHTIKPKERKP